MEEYERTEYTYVKNGRLRPNRRESMERKVKMEGKGWKRQTEQKRSIGENVWEGDGMKGAKFSEKKKKYVKLQRLHCQKYNLEPWYCK